MNKKIITLLVASALMVGVGATSCSDDNLPMPAPHHEEEPEEPDHGKDTPEKPEEDPNLPTDAAKVAPQDLQLLRDIMKENGLASKVASANPREWKMESLYFGFEVDKDSVYHVTSITGSGRGITTLKIMYDDFDKGFEYLKSIKLTNLEVVNKINISDLPALKFLSLDGKQDFYDRHNQALLRIDFQNLPELEDLYLGNFEKLEKNGTTDNFQISLYYGYDKLKKVVLENIGFKDFAISTSQPLEQFELRGDMKLLESINLDEVTMPVLTFTGDKYPRLNNIKLLKLGEGSATELKIEGLNRLEQINVNKCKTLQQAIVKDAASLKAITLSGCGIEQIELSGLPELANIDLSVNNLPTLDASAFSKLRRFDFSHNFLKTFDELKLPKSVHYININGNEDISTLDLSAYGDLESIQCRGVKKELDAKGNVVKKNAPDLGALVQVILPKSAPNLFEVMFDRNRLTDIYFDPSGNFKALEKIYLAHNRLDINKLALVQDLIVKQHADVSRGDFTYAPQHNVPVEVKNNKADYGQAVKILGQDMMKVTLYKDAALKEKAEDNTFDYNKESGVLSFLKAGTYYVHFEITSTQLRDFRRERMVSDAVVIK